MTEKKDKQVLKYDMKKCVGVYHRRDLNNASKKWLDSADPKCCFTVVDKNDAETLYFIANDEGIAENWVKRLKRHVHLNKVDRRKGYFGFYDLQEVYDVLTEEESAPWDIDQLGVSLGLSEGTRKEIEECCSTEKDRLRECLFQWLISSDGDTGGPKCDDLKEALIKNGKENIAKKIDEKFPQKNKGLTKDADNCLQDDARNEEYRENAWTRHGKQNNYKQALATANEATSGEMLLHLVTQKMEQNDVASVLAEICFLSNTKRSSLVRVENETPAKIVYHKCFIARGREAPYVGFDRSVPPNSETGYSFEKHTYHSLDGCAAMLFFSATTCESKECFFVVAFRNYAIKLRRPNKTVVMVLKSLETIDELNDLLQYAKIMNANKNSREVPGMNLEKKYHKPFMLAGRGDRNALKFPSIEFVLYMSNDNYHSESTITVSYPKDR